MGTQTRSVVLCGVSGDRDLYPGGGKGGPQAKTKFVYLKSTPSFGHFIFFPEEPFSDVGVEGARQRLGGPSGQDRRCIMR